VKRTLVKIIPISKHTQRISLSPDDKWAFTADQYKPQIAVIDTASNEIAKTVELPDIGYGTAVTPDGKWLVVALINLNEVGFIDLEQMKLVGTVVVPRAPQEVLIRPDGKMAYVSCDASKQIAAIDLTERKVEKLIDAGNKVDGLAWATTQ
jgi:DNA-binding beta-propeller fold protein YncE